MGKDAETKSVASTEAQTEDKSFSGVLDTLQLRIKQSSKSGIVATEDMGVVTILNVSLGRKPRETYNNNKVEFLILKVVEKGSETVKTVFCDRPNAPFLPLSIANVPARLTIAQWKADRDFHTVKQGETVLYCTKVDLLNGEVSPLEKIEAQMRYAKQYGLSINVTA